jgi:hypothetical protein
MNVNQQSDAISGPLVRAWRTWKIIARRIGDVQARIILTILYFGPMAPFALVLKYSADPLAIKPDTPKGWRPLPDIGPVAATAYRQF